MDGSRRYGGMMDQRMENIPQVNRSEGVPNMEPVQSYPPAGEDYLLTGERKTMNVSSLAAIILAVVAIVSVIIFISWYFGSGKNKAGNRESIKKELETGGDMSPLFKNLTVSQNTVLGTASGDTLKVNAEISSDVIPNDNNKDLGSTTKKWSEVHTNSVVFDTGISMVQDATNDVIYVTEGFGYKRPLKTINSSDTDLLLTPEQSGYMFVLNKDIESEMALTLPEPTGSGNYYDLITATDFLGTSPAIFIYTSGTGNYFAGKATITEEGNGTSGTAVFTTAGETYDTFAVDFTKPVPNYFPGISAGIKKGSTIRLTDYGGWAIDANLFTSTGASPSLMTPPFFLS